MTVAVGDVVTLVSGGHSMAVAEIDGEQALCAWALPGGKTDQKWFRLVVLKKKEAKPAPGFGITVASFERD